MLMLGKVRLHKVVLYKDAELDLDYRGITVIRGRNLNAVSARFKTNGAGKSLLTTAIPNCWFSSHPVLASLGKRASGMKAGMLLEKGSSITTEFMLPEGESVVPYSIVKYAKKSGSIGYTVLRNGKDLGLTTQTKAEKYIESLLPFTEEEFYTHTYLDARRPFLLRVGSPAQRATFFSSMFHMDQYDYIKDRCHAMRAELGDEAIRLEELKRRASDIRKELDSIDYDSIKATLSKAEARSKLFRKKTRRVYDVLTDLKLWVANKDVLIKVMALTGDRLDEDAVSDALGVLRKQAKSLQSRIDSLVEYQSYLDENNRWVRKSKKLRKQLGKDTRSAIELRKAIRIVEEKRQEQGSKLDRCRRDMEDLKRELGRQRVPEYNKGLAAKTMQRYDGRNYSQAIADVGSAVKDLQSQSNTTRRLVGMADDLSRGDDCALCGSDVSHKHGGSIVKGLKRQLKKVNKQLKHAEAALEAVEAAEEAETIRSAHRKIEKRIAKKGKTLRSISRKLDKLPNVERERELLVVRQTLDGLDEPKWKGDVPKGDRKQLRRQLGQVQENQGLLRTIEPIVAKLANVVEKYRGKDVVKLTKGMERRYVRLQKKMTKASEDVARCDPLIRVWAKRTGEYKVISAEVQEKEEALRDAPVLDMLKSVYGSKGLKRRKMLEYANFMEGTMNRYSDAIFHERFRFKFDVGPNSFDIVAITGKGKKERVRDVRVLSGAEGGAFSFLTLAALLFMLPSRQRTNICVLDEMDFGFDPEGRAMLINSFIPELSKIIPHILVVTPLNDEYPGSRSFVATKDGDTTTLTPVQGHGD